jgi:cytochrome c-type biogenesis protein CcmF
MTAELGHIALIMAFMMALLQAGFPLAGAQIGVPVWMAVAKPAARAQFFFLLASFVCLEISFLNNDFSVVYVATNSNTSLPTYYRLSALWGAHEGSMLLWATILGLWTAAVTFFSRSLSDEMLARVLGVMGLVSIGIQLFILTTSNPFDRIVPAPAEGNDLNPLLQDFGMTIHPPMLYMGYVGLSVAFSFAIAALLGGNLDSAWARWSRPWTLVAWAFLTFGIIVGSWWAYYELGWGGWWFWDPVENASFMPWLVATALIHSLAVTEKRGAFKTWTVLLAIFSFSLSLLGTFLVRSGVLTSVHAFASDPARGLFILIFLAVVVGGSLTLYALRAPTVKDNARYSLFSKENLLLVNNILLVVASASVLLGTLYPLVLDALGLGKISVGPPYFTAVFTPVMAPIFLLAGLAPMVPWRKGDIKSLVNRLKYLFEGSLVLGCVLVWVWLDAKDFTAMAGISMALWLAGTVLFTLYSRVRLRPTLWEGLRSQSPSIYGMSLAHFGAAVFLVGVVISNHYSLEKTVKLAPGESVELGPYAFRFQGVASVTGPNYRAKEGTFQILKGDRVVTELKPQKRDYKVKRNTMTEAAISPGLFRDLYVALGEPLDKGSWSVRVYYKPFMRWVWMGGLFMMLGGIVSVSDRRYRLLSKQAGTAADPALAGTVVS